MRVKIVDTRRENKQRHGWKADFKVDNAPKGTIIYQNVHVDIKSSDGEKEQRGGLREDFFGIKRGSNADLMRDQRGMYAGCALGCTRDIVGSRGDIVGSRRISCSRVRFFFPNFVAVGVFEAAVCVVEARGVAFIL